MAVVAVARATVLGVGAPLLGAGHLGTGLVSAQSTAINHVAPVGRVAVAAPLAYGHGIAAPAAYGLGAYGLGGYGLGLGHGGLVGGNLRANGIVGSGILGSRYGSAIAHNAVVGHGVGALGLGYGAVGLGHGALGLGHGAVGLVH